MPLHPNIENSALMLLSFAFVSFFTFLLFYSGYMVAIVIRTHYFAAGP